MRGFCFRRTEGPPLEQIMGQAASGTLPSAASAGRWTRYLAHPSRCFLLGFVRAPPLRLLPSASPINPLDVRAVGAPASPPLASCRDVNPCEAIGK